MNITEETQPLTAVAVAQLAFSVGYFYVIYSHIDNYVNYILLTYFCYLCVGGAC